MSIDSAFFYILTRIRLGESPTERQQFSTVSFPHCVDNLLKKALNPLFFSEIDDSTPIQGSDHENKNEKVFHDCGKLCGLGKLVKGRLHIGKCAILRISDFFQFFDHIWEMRRQMFLFMRIRTKR